MYLAVEAVLTITAACIVHAGYQLVHDVRELSHDRWYLGHLCMAIAIANTEVVTAFLAFWGIYRAVAVSLTVSVLYGIRVWIHPPRPHRHAPAVPNQPTLPHYKQPTLGASYE